MRMTLMAMALTALLTACGGNAASTASTNADTTAVAATAVATFDADSAWALAQRQCDFGPRVPGTPAHSQCATWLMQTLGQSCDTVMLQTGTVTAHAGMPNPLTIKNIIGIINPDAAQRLLLLAHWDTRPWADNDPDPDKHGQPVMGANDGASGVAVLLQVARHLRQAGTTLGVDIVLVDAEDMGNHDDEDSWALGAQYWASHPHVDNYKPLFGILLDMVGAPDAVFPREYYSMQYASGFVEMVWRNAAGNHFSRNDGGAVTDDHVFVNRAGIPCIDIIDQRNSDTGFCPAWHTTSDTMQGITASTLGDVGQTLLNVIHDLEQ